MNKVEIYQHPELDGSSFYLGDGETAVLCLHGFTATTTEVRPLGDFLAQNGYTVAAPLLPGHGTTPTDLNKKTYRDWLNTAENALDRLAKTHKHVFVLGESMGALLALSLLSNHPYLRGGMILAPALRLPRLWQSKFIWPFIRMIPKGGDGDNSMPWKGYNILPLKAAASLFDFQRTVRKELSQISQPMQIFYGKLDKRIDPEGVAIIHETINSSDKELVIMQDSGHVILLDREAKMVFEMCKDFMARVVEETEGKPFGL